MNNKKRDKQLEIKIVSGKQLPDLKLTIRQIKKIIEALAHYRGFVLNCRANSFKRDYELNSVQELIDYLQEISQYNFKSACNKCINKYVKKLREDDPGMEMFGWIVENKKS